MLEVKQLTRCYGTVKAVESVNFSIKKGEIIGLLGQNGAGKTTIMKMISGYLEPDQGTVIIHGKILDNSIMNIPSGVGYLPEILPVYPEMTVYDYMDYVADLKSLRGAEKTAEIKRVLEATNINDRIESRIGILSRGYKQRVGVAQAIIGKPKLLILDEPTNGLDPEQTQQMRRLIREIAKDATVILSTHIMQEVEALCTGVLILHGGRLVLDSSLDDLRKSHQIRLETSLPEASQSLLSEIEGVESVQMLGNNGNQYQYRVVVDEACPCHPVSAAIADQIIASHYKLFSLHAEIHTLETLFREVNTVNYQQETVTDAA